MHEDERKMRALYKWEGLSDSEKEQLKEDFI
jgi:hypothetical protein